MCPDRETFGTFTVSSPGAVSVREGDVVALFAGPGEGVLTSFCVLDGLKDNYWIALGEGVLVSFGDFDGLTLLGGLTPFEREVVALEEEMLFSFGVLMVCNLTVSEYSIQMVRT